MRLFYYDEGPIDALLQIAACPVRDGDLVSKEHRTAFEKLGWVRRDNGFNCITELGANVVKTLRLVRRPNLTASEKASNLQKAFAGYKIPWPFRLTGGR